MKVVSINAHTHTAMTLRLRFILLVVRMCKVHTISYYFFLISHQQQKQKNINSMFLQKQSPWILSVVLVCVFLPEGRLLEKNGYVGASRIHTAMRGKKYCSHKTRSATLWPFIPARIRAGMCQCDTIFKTANFHCSRSQPAERGVDSLVLILTW